MAIRPASTTSTCPTAFFTGPLLPPGRGLDYSVGDSPSCPPQSFRAHRGRTKAQLLLESAKVSDTLLDGSLPLGCSGECSPCSGFSCVDGKGKKNGMKESVEAGKNYK
eukprot:GHVT01085602.1.p1 GENE.GHVT01085602.1~~GHVT01085602.1.p1  ORF type:complete len:108 (+),score=7.05 GHVT01085602.1:99-422(+)